MGTQPFHLNADRSDFPATSLFNKPRASVLITLESVGAGNKLRSFVLFVLLNNFFSRNFEQLPYTILPTKHTHHFPHFPILPTQFPRNSSQHGHRHYTLPTRYSGFSMAQTIIRKVNRGLWWRRQIVLCQHSRHPPTGVGRKIPSGQCLWFYFPCRKLCSALRISRRQFWMERPLVRLFRRKRIPYCVQWTILWRRVCINPSRVESNYQWRNCTRWRKVHHLPILCQGFSPFSPFLGIWSHSLNNRKIRFSFLK